MSDPSYIAAFLTGHSVPGCTGLSQRQRDFQRRSIVPADRWLPWNFPYHPTAPFPEEVALWRASLSNLRHYLHSRSAGFRSAHQKTIADLFDRYERVLILAGSCGLELFNNLELPEAMRRRVHLFAYGPVSRQRPQVASCYFVQGAADEISRRFHRRVDELLPGGHMDYLDAPEMLASFDAYCRRTLPHLPSSA